jgi:rhamnulokinase
MKKSQFLAFDLGAESGRAILGRLEEGKINLTEIHRFPTGMMRIHDNYQWNIYRMYEEMLNSIIKCQSFHNLEPESIAIDTWGVDFSLLGKEGNILDLPFCYRDSRTDGMPEEFFKIMPRERLYRLTGIQIMQFNSVFQLFSMARKHSDILKNATGLLFMPDLFNYLLSGIKSTEFSFATTSQLFNPKADAWEPEIFSSLEVNIGIMQKIVQPGTIIGHMHNHLSTQFGLKELPVISVASHDTGSAIAAIPAEGEDWAYISSGTWSLMGIESKVPLISEKTLAFNITNEGGVNKTFRVLKNIMGLWLLQQSRLVWGKEEYGYVRLVEMASGSEAFTAFIDPDDRRFLNPSDMPGAIREYCVKTGQSVPAGIAGITRIILECLALKYRYTLDQLREISPNPIEKIYIIGGGVRNELLCQFTANACGIPVISGPSEGTALGNILIQAMAMGTLSSLAEIRQIVKASFPSRKFEARDREQWEAAYTKFKSFID